MTTAHKVLLMGPHNGGKTSMRSVIFANYLARETAKLGPTVEALRSQVKLLGTFVFNMWDCGGQQTYVKGYLSKQRQLTFANVGALIYVCDAPVLAAALGADEDAALHDTLADFRETVAALHEFSPDARVFVLVHKSDLLREPEPMYVKIVTALQQHVTMSLQRPEGLREGLDGNAVGNDVPAQDGDETRQPSEGLTPEAAAEFLERVRFFRTTIWDDSLFDAWSTILQCLVPNLALLRQFLRTRLDHSGATEAVVFDGSSLLTVCRVAIDDSETPQGVPATDTLLGGEDEAAVLPAAADPANHPGDNQQPTGRQHEQTPVSVASKPGAPQLASRNRVTGALKKFKLACAKAHRCFTTLSIVSGKVTVVFDRFVANTFLMLVMHNTSTEVARLQLSTLSRSLPMFLQEQGSRGQELLSVL